MSSIFLWTNVAFSVFPPNSDQNWNAKCPVNVTVSLLVVLQGSQTLRLRGASACKDCDWVGEQNKRMVSPFIRTVKPASEGALIFTLSFYYSASSQQSKKQHPPYVNVLCLASVSLAAFRKRLWRMRRAWGISSSSTCSSTAAPWTSAFSCTPKKNRWETAAERSIKVDSP